MAGRFGIQPIFGRPRQSTDNAVVERCHGVLTAWVEPQTSANPGELAQRLAYYSHLQREVYPVEAGQSRLKQFPALPLNPRTYPVEQEEATWQVEQVLAYVAGYTFTRMVEKNGRMTLMAHEYSVGRAYRHQRVTVRLDPVHRVWVVKDRSGEVIQQFPALQFTYSTIAGMTMTHKHFKAKLIGVSSEG